MALCMRQGDYVPDGKGGFARCEGAQEVLERLLWKLSVRRGSFPLLPEVGSRLYLLGRATPGQREALAEQYVMEALADEDVEVTGVELAQRGQEAALTAHVKWQGEALAVTVALGGMV